MLLFMLLKPEYKNNINNEKEIKKYKITGILKWISLSINTTVR